MQESSRSGQSGQSTWVPRLRRAIIPPRRCTWVANKDFSELEFQSNTRSVNEYLLAKFGFDTAENEPCEVRKFELSEMLNLNFEISNLLFATQCTIGSDMNNSPAESTPLAFG